MTTIKTWLAQVRREPDAYLIALLVFLLPFEHIPSIDIRGVTIRPSMIVAVLVIARAGWLWWRQRPRQSLARAIWPLLAFLAWLILLIPGSLNHTRAIQVVTFTAFTIAVALAVARLFQRSYLPLITKALLASALIVCLFGLYQYFGNLAGIGNALTGLRERYSWQVFGFPRIQSTALEPLYFAAFLLLPLAVLMGLTLAGVRRKFGLTIMFLAGVCLFLTVSRGGTLAFGVLVPVSAVLAWLLKPEQMRLKRFGQIALVALLAYAGALLMISQLGKPIGLGPKKHNAIQSYKRQLRKTGLEGTGDERAHSREQALQLFKLHPLLGVGPGNFGPYVQHNQKPATGWSIVNNESLELLAETGLVGFGLFGAFVGRLLLGAYLAARQTRELLVRAWLIGLMGFLVAIAVQYQTFSTLYIMHIWLAIGLLLGLIQTQPEPQARLDDGS